MRFVKITRKTIRMKTSRNLAVGTLFLFLFTSCLNNVNFNQIEDLSAEQVVKSSIVFFTLNQFHFLTNNVEDRVITDVLPFSFLDNPYLIDNLESAEIEFRINNQFNRDFTVDFEFLDENNVATLSFSTFNIASNNLNFVRKETILVSGNTQFLTSKKIRIIVNLLPSLDGSLLDPAINQTIKIRSAGTYYLKVKI